jgi:hypothetical protein
MDQLITDASKATEAFDQSARAVAEFLDKYGVDALPYAQLHKMLVCYRLMHAAEIAIDARLQEAVDLKEEWGNTRPLFTVPDGHGLRVVPGIIGVTT